MIRFQNVTNGIILDNTIKRGKIFLFYSDNNLIINNSLYRNSSIILTSSNSNEIRGNELNYCEFNIYFSNNNLISKNHIFNTSTGIQIYGNINTTIRENIIHNCTEYGIFVYAKSNNTKIIDNYIYFFGFNATFIGGDCQYTELSGNIYNEPNDDGDGSNGNGTFIPDLGAIIILSVLIGGIVVVIILVGIIIYRRRLAKSYAPPDLSE
jgi:parallel beta-helix repeat protein